MITERELIEAIQVKKAAVGLPINNVRETALLIRSFSPIFILCAIEECQETRNPDLIKVVKWILWMYDYNAKKNKLVMCGTKIAGMQTFRDIFIDLILEALDMSVDKMADVLLSQNYTYTCKNKHRQAT